MSGLGGSFDFRFVDTSAGPMPCIVRGPAVGTQVLIVPPLFEEMNRCRALLAGLGRHLAHRGIGSWLPDLSGTGDHPLSITSARIDRWSQDVAELSRLIVGATGTPAHLFSVRGGALLSGITGASRYLLAPVVSGERLLRELMRARLAADQERGAPITMAALEERLKTETVELAGYPLTPALAADLRMARFRSGPPTRTVNLTGTEGDRIFEGPPVWRQAEPASAADLARALADDLSEWIDSCASR